MDSKRGQIGLEYLVTMSFISFIIITLLGISFIYSSSIKDRIKAIEISNFANKIISSAETIFYSGEPSKVIISVYLPENVNSIDIAENTIFVSFQLNSGLTKTGFYSEVPIEGNITSSSGTKRIEIKAVEEKVLINEIKT